MWPDSYKRDVPDEAQAKLETYHALLMKWQNAINLVSPKTLDEAWVRHFLDSAQVVAHIPETVQTVADFGSGAGFAGLVVAILRPDLKVSLIESDERKAQFLRTVSRETQIRVEIFAERIEAVVARSLPPDLVMARALADLETLLGLIAPWAENNPALTGLFLKGAQWEEETQKARMLFDFQADCFQSLTAPEGRIVRVENIRPKGGGVVDSSLKGL